MKRLLLIVSALLFVSATAIADPVTPNDARKVAEQFLHTQALTDVTAQVGCHYAYVFQRTDGDGYVIVAADDRSLPILGYSYTDNVTTPETSTPAPGACYWLRGFDQQIAAAIQRDVQHPAATNAWNQLRSGHDLARTKGDTVGPLMTTHWAQSPRYNILCPEHDGERAVTGCVATGIAQIMRYWEFPKRGYGSHSYSYDDLPYGTIYARFDSVDYKWSKMPDKLSSSTPVNDVRATAMLCYHVGVAVNMHYSPDGSGAWMLNEYVQWDNHPELDPNRASENALHRYFNYTCSDVALRSEYADSTWERLLEQDIRTGHPVLYAGWLIIDGGTYFVQDSIGYTGHAFVLDGITTTEGVNYYHVNWGWGAMDGWYPINALNVSNMTFNDLQGAFLGMEPDSSRLMMADSLFVQRHGNFYYAQVTNIGEKSFSDYLGIQLTNATDTLWLMEPKKVNIHPGDTLILDAHISPQGIPSGDYTATLLFGHTLKFMKPVCDFDHGASTPVYIDLSIEQETPVSTLNAATANGQVKLFGVEAGGQPVVLYDIQGRRLATLLPTSETMTMTLPGAGIYIIRQGARVCRTISTN